MGINKKGFPSLEELRQSPGFYDGEFGEKYVVIECVQEIPCNPCELDCPQEAIKIEKPITNLPVFYPDLCVGCGLCIASCPGQAIFLIDKSFSKEEAMIVFPYEYRPLPSKGEEVAALDRSGREIAKGKVDKVVNSQKNDRTPLVYLLVPFDKVDDIRTIKYHIATEK